MSNPILAMPKYEAYKDSGVEWLGVIPESWSSIKTKFLCLINKESLPENTKGELEFEYVDIGNVSFENGVGAVQKFSFRDSPSRARRLAKDGDTVISTVRTYLKAIDYVDKSKRNYVFSTGFAVLEPKRNFSSHYLTAFVKSNAFTNQVDEASTGISYPAINSTQLSNLFIAVPSLHEQNVIASFLDQKATQIDQAIAIKEKQISLLKERKQILIQNAVTRGLNPDAPLRDSGVEWIGEIPEHWEIKANFFLFTERVESGIEGLPLLSVSIHSGVSRGEMSEEENIRGRVKIEDKTKYNLVEPHDIVFNMMRAWQGGIGAVENKGMVSPAYIIAKPNESIETSYFEYQYRSPIFIQQMDRFSKGITDFRKRLYWDEFKRLKSVVPPVKEQKLIIMYIDSQSTKTKKAIALQNQQIEKLKEYKTTLINSAVTGKIKIPIEPSTS